LLRGLILNRATFKHWRAFLIVVGSISMRLVRGSQDPSSSQSLLERVLDYIDTHYREPISLYEVAKAVERSPAYLTDLVRRETGRTVLKWIIEYRMAEARHCLQETNQTVYNIAEALGYADTGHFIRQFRQYHGFTPQVWREHYQGWLASEQDWARVLSS
jgi:AraC-like DNA-binding protein